MSDSRATMKKASRTSPKIVGIRRLSKLDTTSSRRPFIPPKKDVALPAACREEADLLARWLPFVLPEVLPMIDRRLRSLF